MKLRLRTFAMTALLTLVGGNALAWETRVLTLGDQNRFIEDDANIWIHPQTLMNHDDKFVLEMVHLGSGSPATFSEDRWSGLPAASGVEGSIPAGPISANGGMSWSIDDKWSVGFWTTDHVDYTTPAILRIANKLQTSNGPQFLSDVPVDQEPADCQAAGMAACASDRKLDLFVGHRASEETLLGFRFGWGSSTFYDAVTSVQDDPAGAGRTTNTTTNSYVAESFTVGAGLTQIMSKSSGFDLGLTYDLRTWDFQPGDTSFQVIDPIHSVDLNGRYRMRFSKLWWVAPTMQVRFTSFNDFIDRDQTGAIFTDHTGTGAHETSVNISRVNVDVGLGSHLKVTDKIDVFVASGIDYERITGFAQSNEGSNDMLFERFELPYVRVGAEAPLYDWLTLRAGFRKNVAWWKSTDTTLVNKFEPIQNSPHPHTSEVEAYADAEKTLVDQHFAFVGMTAVAKGWTFTMQLQPDFVFGNWFQQDTWFSRVSLSHRF